MKTHRWNPYLVGVLIGVLSILTFSLADKPIGMSTGIAQAAGACAMPVIGADGVAANTYWAKKAVPAWDYGSLFVLGSFLGALVSAVMSGSFKLESVPAIWRERFGPSVGKRMIAAFIGGVVIIFGARMADGCTSGHGVCGLSRLSPRSLVATLSFMAAGFAMVFIIRHLL
jgi:uncharacterized membrane protein YedE/YeeE